MRFFMEFNRLYNFDVGLVSETLSMSVFHTIQVRLSDLDPFFFFPNLLSLALLSISFILLEFPPSLKVEMMFSHANTEVL